MLPRNPAKRAFDLLFALGGLAVLSPFLIFLALWVKLADGGPVFYRQIRVGLGGRFFRIWKFRTMRVGSDRAGPALTVGGDRRVTPVGRILRARKWDELPQLFNVVAGQMSLVGPRPEVPRYVEKYSAAQREVLQLKPGITDLASIEFRNEEELLKGAENPEEFYIQYCLPRKIDLNLWYARRANLWSDTLLIFRTLFPDLAGGLYPAAPASSGNPLTSRF